MLAMKCDVCKRLYEHYEGNRLFSTSKELNQSNAIKMIDRSIDGNYMGKKIYDLCPECMNKIEQFLYGGKFY